MPPVTAVGAHPFVGVFAQQLDAFHPRVVPVSPEAPSPVGLVDDLSPNEATLAKDRRTPVAPAAFVWHQMLAIVTHHPGKIYFIIDYKNLASKA